MKVHEGSGGVNYVARVINDDVEYCNNVYIDSAADIQSPKCVDATVREPAPDDCDRVEGVDCMGSGALCYEGLAQGRIRRRERRPSPCWPSGQAAAGASLAAGTAKKDKT